MPPAGDAILGVANIRQLLKRESVEIRLILKRPFYTPKGDAMKIQHQILLLGLFLVAMTLLFSQGQAVAGTNLQITPRVDPRLLPYGDQMLKDGSPTAIELSAASAIPSTGWSGFAYQDLRDGQWEVFYVNYGGANRHRLTEGTAQDIQPSLDRGAQRVSFTSNRMGHFDIFTVNTDGSNLRQLTSAKADDMMPAWSPDGRTLLFVSDRSGQAEIYRINADGSGLNQLTNHPAYDGRPAWSPDGQQIAFVSSRDGENYIYIMRADGSNIRRLTTFPFSDNPKWSPDGTEILFDAETDGDGWSELALIELDGSRERTLYNPAGDRTVWANAWAPDSIYVSFTQLKLVEQGGNWYWTNAQVMAIDRWRNNPAQVIISGTGTAWSADWKSTDGDPPSSSLRQLPPYARYNPLTVGWKGQDNGKAGILSYDVQYNENGSGWKNWLSGTTSQENKLVLPVGSEVGLRVRARDNAYNEEPWPPSAQEQTRLFRNLINGTVTDNRGTRLEQLPLLLNPAAIESPVTDKNGAFEVHSWQAGDHKLAANESGFAPLLETTLPADLDLRQNFYLRPANEVVKNGTFEKGNGSPTDWSVTGTLPAVVETGGRASGKYGLRLGQVTSVKQPGPWLPTPASSLLTVAVDQQGVMHVIWNQWLNNGQEELQYSRKQVDGTWSSPETLDTVDRIYEAMLSADDLGRLHLLILDGEGIFYRMRSTNGQWSGKRVLLAADTNTGQYELAGINNGNDNQVHLLFFARKHSESGDLVYHHRQNSGTWDSPIILERVEFLRSPHLAATPDGTQHVTWLGERVEDERSYWYRSRDVSGTWSPVVRIKTDEDYDGPYDLLSDSNGTLHLFTSGRLWHFTKPLLGDWSEPVKVPMDGSVYSNWHYENIAADRQGNLHFLYLKWQNNIPTQYYLHWNKASGWSQKEIWAMDPTITWILFDEANSLRILGRINYQDGLFYGHGQAAGFAEQVALSQTVTVPANMTWPTLSFLARGSGDLPGDGSGLVVTLTPEGGLEETVWNGYVTADWQLFWIDVSAWQGQQVTLSFKLQQEAEDPALTIFLDDVSLGPAAPETWVKTAIFPPGAAKDGVVELTLDLGNRGGVAGQDPLLVLTLDPALTLLDATVPPQQAGQRLTWNLDSLAPEAQQTIVLQLKVSQKKPPGSQLKLTASLEVVGEAYLRNNEAETAVIYGNLSFLPVQHGGG
jgi:TolB protein